MGAARIQVSGTVTDWSYVEGSRPPRGAPWRVIAIGRHGEPVTLAERPTEQQAKQVARAVRAALRKGE